MPTFNTPEPIAVELDVPVGYIWLKASDRADTVVDVRPSNPSGKYDVGTAEQTSVDFAAGRLLVRVPKSWRRFGFGSGPSVDVVIELPTGSSLRMNGDWTRIRAEGRLGECRVKTGSTVRLDETGELELETSSGDVTVDRVGGRATISTGSGTIRLLRVDVAATVKNSSGDCWIGEARGPVELKTASGTITVDLALSNASARTAYGTIRVGEVVRGSLNLQNAYGDIDVGVRVGTAAWLDVNTKHGRVHNGLDATDGPAPTDEKVEIHATTSYGDVTIRRP